MPKPSGKPKSEYAIQTVTNALRMLEVFHGESEMGVSDLARTLGLHKNNAFRLLATLELAGYMEQDPATELYRLGPRCVELGQAFVRSHSLMNRARPILEALAAEAGETAHLGVLTGGEVVHLDGVQPDQIVLTGLRVGRRLEAHCTALGKVLLAGEIERRGRASFRAGVNEAGAALTGGASGASEASDRPSGRITDRAGGVDVETPTDAAVAALYADAPLPRHTPTTVTDPSKLVEELRAVQLRGFAIDREELAPGLHCVAAPVRDGSARVVAAISLSGPAMRLDDHALEGAAADRVTAAAERLSTQLGATPAH